MPIDITKFISPAVSTKPKIDLVKFGVTPKINKPAPKPQMSADNPFNGPVNIPAPKTTIPIVDSGRPLVLNTPLPSSHNQSTPVQGTPEQIKKAVESRNEIVDIPKNAYTDFVKKLKDSIKEHANTPRTSMGAASRTTEQNTKISGKDTQTAVSGVNLLLSPLSAGMKAAENIPVVGVVPKIANKAFELGGKITSKIFDKTLDVLPISKVSKDNLRPAVNDIGNLIGQSIVGLGLHKIGTKAMPKEVIQEIHNDVIENVKKIATEHAEEITPETAKSIVTQAAQMTADKLDQTGMKLLAERTPRPNGIEGEGFIMKDSIDEMSTKESKLNQRYQKRLTEYNKNATEENLAKVLKTKEDLAKVRVQKEQINTQSNIESPKIDVNKFMAEPEKINIQQPTIQRPEIIPGEKFVSKVTEDLTKTFQEKGLLPENFNELPLAERITFADQAKKTAELLGSDLDRVKRIINGDEAMPSDLRIGFLLEGARDLAIKNGDAELAHALANSPLNKETSIHAQETAAMRALQPDSMVSHFSDIKKAREINIEKRTGKKIKEAEIDAVNEIKNEVKKSAPKIKEWSEFIDSLKCK